MQTEPKASAGRPEILACRSALGRVTERNQNAEDYTEQNKPSSGSVRYVVQQA